MTFYKFGLAVKSFLTYVQQEKNVNSGYRGCTVYKQTGGGDLSIYDWLADFSQGANPS